MTASSCSSLKTLFLGFPGWGCGVTDPISTKLNPILNWLRQKKVFIPLNSSIHFNNLKLQQQKLLNVFFVIVKPVKKTWNVHKLRHTLGPRAVVPNRGAAAH